MSSSRLDLTNLPLVSIPTSGQVTGVTSTTADIGTGGVASRRVNLFATSGYDGDASVSLNNGQTLSLPTLSEEEQAQVNALFGNLDIASQEQLSEASRKLARALYAQVGYNPEGITSGGSNEAANTTVSSTTGTGSGRSASAVQTAFAQALQNQSRIPGVAENDANNLDDDDDDNSWASGLQGNVQPQQNFSSSNSTLRSGTASTNSGLTSGSGSGTTSSNLGSGKAPTGPNTSIATPAVVTNINSAGNQYNAATGNQDFDKTVQAVSYMGMLGLQGDMQQMANQVQYNVNRQNQTRHDLADVRQTLANWPENQETEHFIWTSYDKNSGAPIQNEADLNKEQANALKSNLEDQLSSQSDMNQEQQLRLQDVTQKYQQAVNTISNMLKYEHDTVKAIIQNIHT